MSNYSFKVSGWPERVWRNNNEADIARGNVPGSYPYSAFGERVTSGSADGHVLWETGMPNKLTVPNSIQLSVVSTSAADTGKIRIRYLDGNLFEGVETLQLDGTTPVMTAATDIRAINNVYYLDGASVTGNVTGTNGGVTYFRINAGEIQFNTTMQRVPAGKRLMINALYGGATSGSSASRVQIKLETSFINGDSFANQGFLHPLAAIGVQDSSATLGGFGPFPIPAGEWVGFTVWSDKAADITGGYFGWMEDA
jgi:hypothetical protein